MAITPNTTFVAGNVLTAAQQNNFPRGLMAAVVTNTTSQNGVSSETALTSMTITFTAEANRTYKASWIEPNIDSTGGTAGYSLLRFRKTNISGTVLGGAYVATGVALNANNGHIFATFTTTAGSTTVICTATGSGANQNYSRSATVPAVFMIEDIGAA
jgi:hypothetical protein